MKSIEIRTIEEWNKLPKKFDEYTIINLFVSDCWVTVEARENSKVVARGNSKVVAWGNSNVVARGNSNVEAWENSKVVARENSKVVARGNSKVEARENSNVVARENSKVEAWGNSKVEAWGNSKVEANHNSIVIMRDKTRGVTVKGNATKILNETFKHDIFSFSELYPATRNGYITLYKSVVPEKLVDFYTGQFVYKGTIECADFDPNPNRQCGGGFHLSPEPHMALSYNDGFLLKCKVHISDIVVYHSDITKVRCRKVTVIGPV